MQKDVITPKKKSPAQTEKSEKEKDIIEEIREDNSGQYEKAEY